MKKHIAVLIIILFTIFQAIPALALELPSTLNVGLYYGSTAQSSVTLVSGNGFHVGTFLNKIFSSAEQMRDTSLTIRPASGAIEVVGSSGAVIFTATDAQAGLGISPTPDELVAINGIEYRGSVQFFNVDGKLTVINVVDMEKYLYSVVSREMSPSWHVEALKAQAVCARNFASNSLGKHGKYGFDVCSTVDCQAYAGTKSETEQSYEPVNSTRGKVLTYGDKLAAVYYSAAMGPTTEDVKNVWGNSVPYLISVPNPYEDTANIPNGVWSGTLTLDEATTIMRDKGYDVGNVTGIKAMEYSPSGRVTKLQVTGTTATKTFERESCRTIFSKVTKSQMYTVVGNADRAGDGSIWVTDGETSREVKINSIIMQSRDASGALNAEQLYTSNGIYQKTYQKSGTAGTNTAFTFGGMGWGHGVGMSQYGAKGMAEAGFSYNDILLSFFPGTILSTVY